MSEFMYDKEKYIEKNEQIIFENNTDSSFGVETGIVFHKSGLYDVDISNNHIVVSKVDERKTIEEAYQKGFEVGSHEATMLEYQRGLDDAWETITKIAKMPDGERMTHFGEVWISNILSTYSLDQIFTILEKNESEPDEIKVGDEVEAYSGRAIVFGTFTDTKGNKFCKYWYPSDDSFNKDKTENLKRTGRNFPQVAELIEAIKDDQRICSTCKYNDGSDVSKCSDCCLSKEYNKWEPKEGAQ